MRGLFVTASIVILWLAPSSCGIEEGPVGHAAELIPGLIPELVPELVAAPASPVVVAAPIEPAVGSFVSFLPALPAVDDETAGADTPPALPREWVPPVVGQITSRFGDARDEGVHDAIDIAAEMGADVVAPADLVVSTIAYQTRAGRYLVADVLRDDGTTRGDGWRLTFAHLSSTAVFEGDRVKKGDKLGLIGLSGTASGPHLHFRVERVTAGDDGRKREAVDPLAVFTEAQLGGATGGETVAAVAE